MNRSASIRRRIASLQNEIASVEEQLANLDEGHQAHTIIDEYDYNQDGFIEEAEWSGSPSLFDTLDTDMDGMLSPAELDMGFGPGFGTTKLASKRAAKHKGLARRKLAHTFFDAYDTNMDGFIDESEWGGSPEAFDALDTNMDGMLDHEEIDLGVGSPFSKLAEDEYLTPQEMADLMGGTLISKQAGLTPNKHQVLDMLAKSLGGTVNPLSISQDSRYLLPGFDPKGVLEAYVKVGAFSVFLSIYVDAQEIAIHVYHILSEGKYTYDYDLTGSFTRDDDWLNIMTDKIKYALKKIRMKRHKNTILDY